MKRVVSGALHPVGEAYCVDGRPDHDWTAARVGTDTGWWQCTRCEVLDDTPRRAQNRTPEQGHTARCMAAAMIAAVENWRDYVLADFGPDTAQYRFRCWAQDNGALTEADSYLADSTMTCTCPPVAVTL